MQFVSYLFVALIAIFTPFSVFAIDTNPLNYGAVVDDDFDDSEAIQAAVNAVIEKGGGTISFPSGKLNLKNIVRLVPANYIGAEIKLKGSRGSVVEVSTGINGYGLYAGNLNVLSIEDMIFVGKNVPDGDPAFYDAKYVVFSNFVQQTNIIRSQFFGLGVPSGGAVIYVGNTDAKIVDSQFDGSLAQYPDGAVVLSENSRGLTVSRTTFMDYAQFYGTYISKTPSFTGSWVKVIGGMALNGNGFRRTVIEDCRFDEGAAQAVWVENVQWASLTGNSTNVNGSVPGRGFYFKDVEHAIVSQSWFGYTTYERPALDLINVNAIEVTSLKLGGGVYFLRRQNVENLIVKFCPQCTPGGGQNNRPSP